MRYALEIDHHLSDEPLLHFLSQVLHPVPLAEATHVVVVGGDGFMLQTLKRHLSLGYRLPMYGLNRGTLGFLMNPLCRDALENLPSTIMAAKAITLAPLYMIALDQDGHTHEHLAFNEVYLWRSTTQTAHIQVTIDDTVRVAPLVSDGVILATPAGSTAYNYSAYGPILPLESNVLALTPISPFRPRRWRGALVPQSAKVVFDVMDPEKRPVSAVADTVDVPNIIRVTITLAPKYAFTLLFDHDHSLDARIQAEQFGIMG